MKQLKTLIGLGVLLAVSLASAQQYTVSSIAITNSLAPTLATTQTAAQQTILGGTNSLTKWGDCALQFRGAASAADATVKTIVIVPSLDGVNFSSVGDDAFVWKIAGNGTTTVTSVTNLPTSWVGSYGYWKISYITNAAATASFTNATLTVATKPKRFGS